MDRSDLITENINLVHLVARQVIQRLPSHVDLDDLVSAGMLGLVDAAAKYDPARENKFRTYAEYRIRGAILDDLRDRDMLPRTFREKIRAIQTVKTDLEARLGRPATTAELSEAMWCDASEIERTLRIQEGAVIVSLDDQTERFVERSEGAVAEDALVGHERRERLLWAIASLPEKQAKCVYLFFSRILASARSASGWASPNLVLANC